MRKKPAKKGPGREYAGVIVGIRTETATVEHVWLRKDGGMSSGGFLHYPADGHTVAGEAMTIFGLSQFGIFPSQSVAAAAAYAAKLQVILEGDAGPPTLH